MADLITDTIAKNAQTGAQSAITDEINHMSAQAKAAEQSVAAQFRAIPKAVWWFGGAAALALYLRKDLGHIFGKG